MGLAFLHFRTVLFRSRTLLFYRLPLEALMSRPHAPHPRRWWILAVLVLSLLVVGIDTLILNVALPTLQRDLGATGSDLQWTVDSYALAFGGLLLLAGGLGDRFGRRRVLFTGFLVFGGASLGAAFADDIDVLIAARVAMGVGAALIMPSTLSVIKVVFPPEEQARAVSIWAGGAALGIPLGPVVGGALLEQYWWGSVFLVNVPVVALALLAGMLLIPESRDPSGARLDVVGALLSAVALATLVYALIEAPAHGWLSGTTAALLSASAVLAVLFVAWERHTPRPLLPMSLLTDRRVGGPVVAVVLVGFALFGAMFTLTQYLQFVLGYEPLDAGLRLMPIMTLVAAAPLGAHAVRRLGLNRTTALGLAVITLAVTMFALLTVDSGTQALVGVGILGIGMGFALPTASDAILAATPSDKAGVGSALTDAALQVGGSLGVAVLGSVLNGTYGDAMAGPAASLPGPAATAVEDSIAAVAPVAQQLPPDAGSALVAAARQAFVDGQQDALVVAAVVVGLGVLVARALLPRHVHRAEIRHLDPAESAPVATIGAEAGR
jgi:EmrB/QacA subfamily drug resistance transporter